VDDNARGGKGDAFVHMVERELNYRNKPDLFQTTKSSVTKGIAKREKTPFIDKEPEPLTPSVFIVGDITKSGKLPYPTSRIYQHPCKFDPFL